MRDPDDTLVVLFRHQAFENPAKSTEAGRPIFDDLEVCEIRAPGSKDVKIFKATDVTRWVDDPVTRQQRQETYAERFRYQYQQFKRDLVQTKSGTPLEHVPFLSDARRAELRAQNVYTVEQLAAIEGSELKNLGPSGREFKNQAVAFIADSMASAPNKQLLLELEALKARNAILEEDFQHKKSREEAEEGEFAGMEAEELRDYIKTHAGQEPIGAKNMNRKTLIRMAMSVRPAKVA